ncbi:MAG: hypothetical protein NVS2B12_24920 [Ktedonobacteraceae bacterium]
MKFEPYDDHAQRGWNPAGTPGTQQSYNVPNTGPAHHPAMSPAALAMAPQGWQHPAVTPYTPSLLAALLAFPLIVLATYAWPIPTTFARHKEHATWSVLVALLVLQALVASALLYAWGRVPTLKLGIEALSMNHLTPQPLAPALVVILALVLPLLAPGFAGALHSVARAQRGQGSYRVQLYSILVIEAAPVLLLVTTALVLTAMPLLGIVARLPLACITFVLVSYSLLLTLLSLMGVQKLSAGKSLLCLSSVLIVVLLLVALAAVFDANISHPDGGGGNGSFKKERHGPARTCTRCGFSLEIYDRLHQNQTAAQNCPKCGYPLA